MKSLAAIVIDLEDKSQLGKWLEKECIWESTEMNTPMPFKYILEWNKW